MVLITSVELVQWAHTSLMTSRPRVSTVPLTPAHQTTTPAARWGPPVSLSAPTGVKLRRASVNFVTNTRFVCLSLPMTSTVSVSGDIMELVWEKTLASVSVMDSVEMEENVWWIQRESLTVNVLEVLLVFNALRSPSLPTLPEVLLELFCSSLFWSCLFG